MCFYNPLIRLACVYEEIRKMRLKARMQMNFWLFNTYCTFNPYYPLNDNWKQLTYSKPNI
ncbi:hypothetical protein ALO61_200159 [Pseudomonas savastanoi pv. nerii]|uniref:Uncharacterized protein n=1 Tax=Pseudomonas savastanoi pv. nerii TaxID=360921 RepID=A0A0P9WPK5_PSESS|nr:hypothetical protein AC519_4673 [Pseudomonas savastanoi]KPY04931.1 hypothetical protein ALO61_200159 [Pseudomonas savastanoi pv. nerii]KPY48743.1 Unknown protein sequence [Pseudomonas savastanoi pv. retacarpa]KPY65733.1 Unknown protein sequence [Pseudomonas savastanoi pv. savastanoi]RML30796.1 hypothetical protein ALR00_03261 [Pseudomonas savastanoi pv. retacarpa]